MACGVLLAVATFLVTPCNGHIRNSTNNVDSSESGVADVNSPIFGKLKRPGGARTMSQSEINRLTDPHQMPKSRYESILSGVYLQTDARIIGSRLRTIANEELKITRMQAYYDSIHFPVVTPNPKEQVEEISRRLQKKIEKYFAVLERNEQAVQALYSQHLISTVSSANLCCNIPVKDLKFDEQFGTHVSKESTCDMHPPGLPGNIFLPGINLTSVFKSNLKDQVMIKWQYFISTHHVHAEYPAYNLNVDGDCNMENYARHRDIYLATVQQNPKHVIIVLDHGNSMGLVQLNTAKRIGKYILSTLSHHDKVGLIGLSSEAQFAQSGGCSSDEMANATYETKFHYARFIDSLRKDEEPTNHLSGFMKAFEMVHTALLHLANTSETGQEFLIAYISRGLLSSIADAKVIIEAIAKENHKTGNRVIINTYTVLEKGKSVVFEKTFLQDVAEQSYKKYHVDIPDLGNAKPGMMVTVTSTDSLPLTIGNFWSVLTQENRSAIKFSLPYWDNIGKGLVVSISKPVYLWEQPLGMVGIDIPLADLAEDVTYFGHLPRSYAFLIEEMGIAVMHPSFGRPESSTCQPMHTGIWHLENTKGIHRAISSDVVNPEESQSNISHETSDVVARLNAQMKEVDVIYNWKKVLNTPYTVCIVTVAEEEKKEIKPEADAIDSEFLFHRLDLAPSKVMCLHLKQLSTLDAPTIFLSAACFLSPFEYLVEPETKQMVQGYMAYLNDVTKLIANPGLKSYVRNDVLALAQIGEEWKLRMMGNNFSKYIVRRYASTHGGVFLMYPGTVIDKSYDPTKRDWYTRALDYPGRVVLTAPYLDVGGAGYIVTLSSTIFEGKYSSMHSTSDTVVGMMGMDMTMSYFYKMLLEVIPFCEEERITCFILDDRGYLIAHPSLVDPNGRGPAEQQHITHKEPLVASDILKHKDFVKKRVCNSYSDRTVQRLYQFNITLESVLTNWINGESCAKYLISAVAGTNVFVGIVNQTCEVVKTFCPCSTTDRLCLNCHRMEQTECECPCECPLEMNICSGELMDDKDDNPSCPRVPEEVHPASVELGLIDSLDQCYEIKCYTRSTRSDCLGVLGCEWCQLDSDGATPLKRQVCLDQRKCFGGVLGARTPYADEIIGLPAEDSFSKNDPVGPVAGGVMAFFLVLAFAVYCYRHHLQRGISSEYITSALPDGTVPMAHFENEVEEPAPNEEHLPQTGQAANAVIGNVENAVVSPYQVASGYRRRPGGDSDPGYSTMTPHEDSEHLSYIEPLLIGKDRHKIPNSQLPFNSRGSSPAANQTTATTPLMQQPTSPLYGGHQYWTQYFSRDPSQTVIHEIPVGPQLLANVQVHMTDAH